jgi:hypothetical protein
LNKEVGIYQDYKLAVQLWQAKDEAEQYDVKLRINETNKTTVNAFCDVRFPTRDVDEQHIASRRSSSTSRFRASNIPAASCGQLVRQPQDWLQLRDGLAQ